MLKEGDLGNLISLILTFLAGLLGYIYAYCYESKKKVVNNSLDIFPESELPPLPQIKLTIEQLKRFDGTRPDGRILIAFKGKIYDVSSNVNEFGLQGTLNRVAGRDFTKYLKIIMCLNESEVNILESWEHVLEMNYQRVGVLIDEQGQILLGDYDGGEEITLIEELSDNNKAAQQQQQVNVDESKADGMMGHPKAQ